MQFKAVRGSRLSRASVGMTLAGLGLGLALASLPDHAPLAKEQGTWAVEGKLLGKPGKKSEDASGIACAAPQGFPRPCVVIDDNSQAAQFVTVNDGDIVAGVAIPLIDNSFEGKALELDGEGVAYADGFYYVIGSHGHPRDSDHKLDPVRDAAKIEARIAAASQIVRFRAGTDGAVSAIERTAKLRAVMAAEPALAPYLDRRLENNGLTIEGIAIRQGRMLVGYREPALSNGRAAVLSVAIEGLFGNAPPDARLYRLPLGEGRGVRDLATFGDTVLILAGPATADPGPAAIYRWDGESEDVLLLKDLAGLVGKDGTRKPEALLPLDASPSGLRVLILFDGEKEGAPAAITIPGP
jgi:hypothetical protein